MKTVLSSKSMQNIHARANAYENLSNKMQIYTNNFYNKRKKNYKQKLLELERRINHLQN